MKAVSVGFVHAVEHVGLFSLPKRLALGGSLFVRVHATDLF